MSDLLPEQQFHSHDRVALSMSLLIGLSIAGGVGLLESYEHGYGGHGHDYALAAAEHDAEHGGVHVDFGGPAVHDHAQAGADQGHAQDPHDGTASAWPDEDDSSHARQAAHEVPRKDATTDATVHTHGDHG